MTKELSDIYSMAANGDTQAMEFIGGWNVYCQSTDDFVDEKQNNADRLIELCVLANLIYSTPFYQQHADKLCEVVQKVTADYSASLDWEKDETDWKARWADTLRFSGNHMIEAIAGITGGYELRERVALLLREDSWKIHHDGDKPI